MTYDNRHHTFKFQHNHKLGIHLGGPNPGSMKAVAQLRPKVLKTMDFSYEYLQAYRNANPDAFIIGRMHVANQDYGLNSNEATRKGIALADEVVKLRPEPNLINAWESFNEAIPANAPDTSHRLYDTFQVAFRERLLRWGYEAIAWNFGTGHGDGNKWLKCYPQTLASYKYLGFHEYDWPLFRLHDNDNEGGEWLALRYRRIMRPIIEALGDIFTVIITEVGVTQGVLGGPDEGWRTNTTLGLALDKKDYFNQLMRYNSYLLQDKFVMGACIFTTGGAGWGTFEIVPDITDQLLAYQTPPHTPPIQKPEPQEPPDFLLRRAKEQGFKEGWEAAINAFHGWLEEYKHGNVTK